MVILIDTGEPRLEEILILGLDLGGQGQNLMTLAPEIGELRLRILEKLTSSTTSPPTFPSLPTRLTSTRSPPPTEPVSGRTLSPFDRSVSAAVLAAQQRPDTCSSTEICHRSSFRGMFIISVHESSGTSEQGTLLGQQFCPL